MKRLIGAFLLSLCVVSASWAAVAWQSTTAFINPTADTSHTESVTVSSGSNLVLVVSVGIEDASNTVSGITFNGDALTYHSRHACSPVSTIEWWYLINPDVATANMVVTVTGAEQFAGGATVVTGAHQTTPLGTVTYNGTGSTCATTANPSITITDGATGDLVIDHLMEAQGAHTVGAGQTERFNNSCQNSYCSTGSTEAGGSSVTMSWTLGAGDRQQSAVNIFQAAAGGGAETFGFRLRLVQ